MADVEVNIGFQSGESARNFVEVVEFDKFLGIMSSRIFKFWAILMIFTLLVSTE